MKHLRTKLLFWTCIFSGQLYAQSTPDSFTSIELQPTSAYLNYQGAAARMVHLQFVGGKSYAPATAYISFNGHTDSVQIPANAAGISSYELPVPGAPVQQNTELQVRYVGGKTAFRASCTVTPARQWKVYVMPHSHVDIGYTDVQEKVLAIHMNNIDEAIKIAARTANYPPAARFKWNTEALWVVDQYLARASDEKKQTFRDAVKKGWINLDGSYANTNTSATSSAQLLQLFYTGAKLAKDYGMTIHTLFQGDVPGATWGLSSQANITGIKYFLSAPNASDRIGSADLWRDKPFYWRDASGTASLLFWQVSPYSIGYTLKGSKIPNFFTIPDPKPYYTGKPSENFLNPYLFDYLSNLENSSFPYDMTLLTWAMSDNAPIDPELPDAVKAWNERYASPQLIITSVKQFFTDFETAWKEKIPVMSGDYSEYWTDGIGSAARETAINRNASDRLQQAGAIWALRHKPGYPADSFHRTWTNLLLFNEHTWGAYNSVSDPADPKVISQWAYKQAFALQAQSGSQQLLALSTSGAANTTATNTVDVYNTIDHARHTLVTIPAALSTAGDLVKDAQGHILPSQRLSTGELAFQTTLPPFSKQRFTIHPGKAAVTQQASVSDSSLENGIYSIRVNKHTGNISTLLKKGFKMNFADGAGLNQYNYLPGDSAEKVQFNGPATITIKEKGPLVVSLLVNSAAPSARSLQREIRLTAGEDRITLINTIDKIAIGDKESVHFAFPFRLQNVQVRYSIPWGSIRAEADQLPHTNRNWYTQQRWVDVSNTEAGVTWSSPDAPLFEIGQYPTAGLLESLHHSPLWIDSMKQQPLISSWVMNNLWHTNFRRDQEGLTTFRYFLQVHGAFNAAAANASGLENHQPPVVVPATGPATESLFFTISNPDVYTENIYPAKDGQGVILQLVNTAAHSSSVTLTPKNKKTKLQIVTCDLLENTQQSLPGTFSIPGKGIIMIRVH
ncbi:MAG: glycoside hydrolase [Chitinophaga sp.]|uniref:glycoside hydrolase family 38 N-terminal domain-containing protein n=1 Tax=Chitinophaga sp. TaxID=1869181 RepID=UPI001B177A77|nr:glycoside hydrolase family 38 C-terminal domain-containing protein [Chitinophaga sp.]MBO9728323.1 glycoside hydrolase [Chitinophaga sp.]